MLKCSCFLLPLVCLSSLLPAQVLTQAANEPSIGDVDVNYRLDTSAYINGLPAAVSGSNVTWDFSMVSGAFPLQFDSMLAPNAVPQGTAFPLASYVQKRGKILSFFKSTTSPSRTELVGASSPSPPLSITFSNSGIVAEYPVSYGYNKTDAVTGSFTYSTTTGVCNGSITVVADGTGTLVLPGNVKFTNVLRLRSYEQLTLTASFVPVGTIQQSIFSYYVPGKKYPVITAQYQKYQLLVGTPTITAQAYGSDQYFTVAGLQPNTFAKLKPYPNPFTDLIHLDSYIPTEAVLWKLYNSIGAEVAESGPGSTMDTKNIPPGIYILSGERGGVLQRFRLVKN